MCLFFMQVIISRHSFNINIIHLFSIEVLSNWPAEKKKKKERNTTNMTQLFCG